MPRYETGSALRLDVRALVRAGARSGCVTWRGGAEVGFWLDLASPRLDLDYVSGGQPVQERIVLTPTPCYFGGRRWWACCPGCGARVAVLYKPRCGAFLCRGCHRLAYTSTRESALSRAIRRAQSARRRLGGGPSLLESIPLRPRGMWTGTYARLLSASLRVEREVGAALQGWLSRRA